MGRAVRRRTDGWWYPWIFVAALLVVVAVNAVMATLAIGTFPGLETKDYYRKGIAYNDNLAAARAQHERGWQMTFTFDGETAAPVKGQHGGVLIVRFADRSGAPLSGLSVSAILTRPTQDGYDFSLPLADQGDGSYRTNVSMPLRGLWEARILAALGKARFQDTHRLIVP